MTDKPDYGFGIWIIGEGWLRVDNLPFAASVRDFAEQAKKMYLASRHGGIKKRAYVQYIDSSMIAMEKVFLENEKIAMGNPWYKQILHRR